MRFSAHHLAALQRNREHTRFADAAPYRRPEPEAGGLGVFIRLGLVLLTVFGATTFVMWLGQ